MLQGICWDLDGTLVNYQIDYIRVRTITKEILETHGYPPNRLRMDQLIAQMVNQASEYFSEECLFSREKIEAIRHEVDATIITVEEEDDFTSHTHDGN